MSGILLVHQAVLFFIGVIELPMLTLVKVVHFHSFCLVKSTTETPLNTNQSDPTVNHEIKKIILFINI